VAPGGLASHYAPRAKLRLDATRLRAGEAALDFGGVLTGLGAAKLDLSPTADLLEAAANLFAHLRALDAAGAAQIAVAPIPERDLGAAINDRLRRAAAPRPSSAPDRGRRLLTTPRSTGSRGRPPAPWDDCRWRLADVIVGSQTSRDAHRGKDGNAC